MDDRPNLSRSRLAFDQGELAYDFGPEHPMKPQRIIALMDLLKTSKLWKPDDTLSQLPIRAATVEELKLIHSEAYIAAVKLLSAAEEIDAFRNGIGTETTHMSRE